MSSPGSKARKGAAAGSAAGKRAKALSGNSFLKATIAELEGLVIRRKEELSSLSAARARLAMRAAVVHLVDRHSRALLDLGALLKRHRRGGGDGGGDDDANGSGSGDGPALSSGSSTLPSSADDGAAGADGDLEIDGAPPQGGSAYTGDEDPNSSSGSDTAAARGAGVAELPLGWSPAAVAARAAETDVSLEGLRKQLREFVLTCAPLLIRRQRGAPDAAAAAARIEAEHSSLLELCALIALGGAGAGGPSPFSRILLTPLEGAPPANGAGPVVDDAHWDWAVSQLKLSGGQLSRLMTFLDVIRERVARIDAERASLLAACAAAADDAAEGERLVARLVVVQRGYEVVSGAAVLALYGSLLTADQVAGFFVACYPYVPSVSGLHRTLLQRQKDAAAARDAEAEAAAGAGEGTGPSPARRDRRRKAPATTAAAAAAAAEAAEAAGAGAPDAAAAGRDISIKMEHPPHAGNGVGAAPGGSGETCSSCSTRGLQGRAC
ncbi:hypothetical protein Rsub_02615 [Raphidocelis subcapitata]|uniref:Uncharacterized protein n=1 Tax=Raphidocelis subcapitata TaxID=307507 RepID=A0A2V0NQK2_9CHLO|nr:hypothetical protein Rsub_02615 [Raphidocelis subcapitata]|eukprot:GBF89911.1 hypothetical protein Rsub_02615 [Raphidocelis subcapitata]